MKSNEKKALCRSTCSKFDLNTTILRETVRQEKEENETVTGPARLFHIGLSFNYLLLK